MDGLAVVEVSEVLTVDPDAQMGAWWTAWTRTCGKSILMTGLQRRTGVYFAGFIIFVVYCNWALKYVIQLEYGCGKLCVFVL